MARTETVTVVFTDLVGSTDLASRLGHDAYEALRHEHFSALRTAVAAHNGTEVKTTGDGLMLAFASGADAIACAVAMQQATDVAARRANRRERAAELIAAGLVEAGQLGMAGEILRLERMRERLDGSAPMPR